MTITFSKWFLWSAPPGVQTTERHKKRVGQQCGNSGGERSAVVVARSAAASAVDETGGQILMLSLRTFRSANRQTPDTKARCARAVVIQELLDRQGDPVAFTVTVAREDRNDVTLRRRASS